MELAASLETGEPYGPLTEAEALRRDLTEARAETARHVQQLHSFQRAVRSTVIEKVRDGTICQAGANKALEDWGLEPYHPRFDVRVELSVLVTVDADSSDDARDLVYDEIAASCGGYECEVDDTTIRYVEEVAE